MDHDKKAAEQREREAAKPAHGEPRVEEEMERIAETNLPKEGAATEVDRTRTRPSRKP